MAIEIDQQTLNKNVHKEKRKRPMGLNAENAGNIAMACLFLLFVFVVAIAQLVLPDRQFSAQENRYLTSKPVFTWQKLLNAQYMNQMELYLTDQFPSRDRWVSFKALAQYLSNQKENNLVYFADDGYLIGKSQAVNAEILQRNLQSVKDLEGAGYQVALLVSPMAGEVLQDKLPAWAYNQGQAEMLAKLSKEVAKPFVDVKPYLTQAAARGQQVFFRTDHHWTMAGAYQAYLAYMEWLGERAIPITELQEEVVSDTFYGTLWSKNSLPGIEPDSISIFQSVQGNQPITAPYDVTYFDGSRTWQTSSVYQQSFLQEKDQYAYFLGQNQPLVVIRRQETPIDSEEGLEGEQDGEALGRAVGEASTKTGEAERRKLLIFKDSYAHAFVPFLLTHFDEIHLVDLRYWKQDPIAYLKDQGISQVLFLYSADDFAGDRSISQVGAYLSKHK